MSTSYTKPTTPYPSLKKTHKKKKKTHKNKTLFAVAKNKHTYVYMYTAYLESLC